MARIVFTTLGSLGDLYPMLPVADRVRGRGHDVVFAAPTHLAQSLTREGFQCVPIDTRPFAPRVPSVDPAVVRARIVERLPEIMRSTLAALAKVCDGADLMVTHPHQLAAAVAARKAGLRWITLSVYPGFVPSAYTVPQPHWLPALPTPVGRAVNRATWRVFKFGLKHLSGDIVNASVEAQGLARDDEIFMPGGLSPHLTLVLSSPLYSPRQPDWPESVRLTGYTSWDEPRDWADPPELKRFLAAGEPPIVITTSTAGERDAVSFFRQAVDALQLTGRRGILLLGGASGRLDPTTEARLGTQVAAWRYLPLSRVVPRASSVVHHGGIGTTLTTLRHGRPAIAVPAIFDQWYNAARVKALGVGRVLNWNRLTPERLAAEITALLSRPDYAVRAGELRQGLATEDGAGRAADEIDALLTPAQAPG